MASVVHCVQPALGVWRFESSFEPNPFSLQSVIKHQVLDIELIKMRK